MRVTTKGQITIPVHIRRLLGIKPGSDVTFEASGDHVYLAKRTKIKINSRLARACGTATVRMGTNEILALTR